MVQEDEERKRLREEIEASVMSSLGALGRDKIIYIWQALHTPEVDGILRRMRRWAIEPLAVFPSRVLP